MLGKKRTNPMIGKLSELFISGTGISSDSSNNHTTSPRSPLDYKIQSPRGLKSHDLGGVGLGIVVALNKSGSINASQGGHEILAKYARCNINLNRSDPIPVEFSGKICRRINNKGGDLLMETDNLENYTYVTRNKCPNNTKPFTEVYYDGGDQCCGHNRFGFEPALGRVVGEDLPVFPTSDFLSSCQLCKKNLHGKDIYMYGGEKAFCSPECRSRQIMIEERKEQCRSEVPRSAADVKSSSCATSPIFSTGILAI